MENESYEGDQGGIYGLDESFDTGLEPGGSSSDLMGGAGSGSGSSRDPFSGFVPGRNKPSNPWSATESETTRALRNMDLESEKEKIKIQSPNLFSGSSLDDIRERLKNNPSALKELDLYDYKTASERNQKNIDRTDRFGDEERKKRALLDGAKPIGPFEDTRGSGGGRNRISSSAPIITPGPKPEQARFQMPFNIQMPTPGSGVKKNYYDVVRDLLNAMSHYR